MNSISIDNNKVHYHSQHTYVYKGKSWTLHLDDVEVIGGINLMDGDDDSIFILFVDKNLQKYFLNLTWEIDGYKSFKKLFETTFETDLNDWSLDFYDNEKVIYPPHLSGHKLYQSSWRKRLRILFARDHLADGELSEEVIDYLKSKNQV